MFLTLFEEVVLQFRQLFNDYIYGAGYEGRDDAYLDEDNPPDDILAQREAFRQLLALLVLEQHVLAHFIVQALRAES